MKRLALAVMIFMMACAGTPEDSQSTEVRTISYSPPPEDPYVEVKQTQREIDLWHRVIWNNQVWENELERQAAIRRNQQRKALLRRREATSPTIGNGACGGNLPSCSILQCESGGNIRAQNPSSSASGKWQITRDTWGNYKGYPSASSAPEHIQDERAAQIYADRGSQPWKACA